ncbi:alpha/beta hydrolase [Anaerocolumna sp.]|uniref:alpha/beta hydrolase n=1 Tax=Anaerocolumna sp. TaxID=2041569 RepID=UPI0028ADA2E0|nr:alpha/beta fold hydrolase [Anaerocolumna sp.]
MGEKTENVLKKYVLPTCFMCVITLLIFLYLTEMKSLALGFLLMALLLFIINVLFRLLVSKGMKGTSIITKTTKGFLFLFILFVNLTIAFSATILLFSDEMFFYPNQDIESYEKNQKYKKYEEIQFNKDNKEFSGWLLKNEKGRAPLVLYFGGNGECSARRFHSNKDADYWNYFDGYNFMMVDYPGYGNSKGTPSDESMFDMALKTYDYAITREDVDSDNIVIMGYSIGTGVATYLASQRNIRGLILMAPYDEGVSLYNSILDIFHGPLKYLVRNKFESIKYAKSVDIQPLLLVSKADELIPNESSLHLSDAFPNGSVLYFLKDVKHNFFWGNKEVFENLNKYLQEVKYE